VILHFTQRSEARAGTLNPLILSGKDSGARSVFFSGGDEGVDGSGEGAREGARRGDTVESSKQRRRHGGAYTGDGGVDGVEGTVETIKRGVSGGVGIMADDKRKERRGRVRGRGPRAGGMAGRTRATAGSMALGKQERRWDGASEGSRRAN
jgi:hypothetical protein